MKKLFLAIALLASPIFANMSNENSASCGCDITLFTMDVLTEKCPVTNVTEAKKEKPKTFIGRMMAKKSRMADFSFSALTGAASAILMTYCFKSVDALTGLQGIGKYTAMIPAGYVGSILSAFGFEKIHARYYNFKKDHKIEAEGCCCGEYNDYNVAGFGTGFIGAALFMIGKGIKNTYFA
ncbi:MAG: hypothetical protein M1114_06340 [Candidatus Dependentiae bacterium]|nr:hypothetical protein [Candidatus Dependentiae bacterium]